MSTFAVASNRVTFQKPCRGNRICKMECSCTSLVWTDFLHLSHLHHRHHHNHHLHHPPFPNRIFSPSICASATARHLAKAMLWSKNPKRSTGDSGKRSSSASHLGEKPLQRVPRGETTSTWDILERWRKRQIEMVSNWLMVKDILVARDETIQLLSNYPLPLRRIIPVWGLKAGTKFKSCLYVRVKQALQQDMKRLQVSQSPYLTFHQIVYKSFAGAHKDPQKKGMAPAHLAAPASPRHQFCSPGIKSIDPCGSLLRSAVGQAQNRFCGFQLVGMSPDEWTLADYLGFPKTVDNLRTSGQNMPDFVDTGWTFNILIRNARRNVEGYSNQDPVAELPIMAEDYWTAESNRLNNCYSKSCYEVWTRRKKPSLGHLQRLLTWLGSPRF